MAQFDYNQLQLLLGHISKGILDEQWRFLDDLNNSKIRDDKFLLPIKNFEHVVEKIERVFSPATVFYFLNKIATPDIYNQEYKAMHACLLVLYQLISGTPHGDMSAFTPENGNFETRGVSGGERKGVSIGMELVGAPDLLLLDEPTTGLDSSSSDQICRLLERMCKQEKVSAITTIHSRIFNLRVYIGDR